MIWPLIGLLSKTIYYSSSFSYSLVTLVIFLFPKLDEVSSLTKLETLLFPLCLRCSNLNPVKLTLCMTKCLSFFRSQFKYHLHEVFQTILFKVAFPRD